MSSNEMHMVEQRLVSDFGILPDLHLKNEIKFDL